MNIAKQRIDLLLVAKGFCVSREKAQRMIMAGDVMVGTKVIDKPGTRVAEDADVVLRASEKYVGRGGLKLEGALQSFRLSVKGAICLDVGASTGGFTDCLLQHGAAKVYAIDVGHSQLDWKIRADPRVVVREHLNARYLTEDDVPELIDLCVIDVSFISLTLILPSVAKLVRPTGVIVALIKPQFELQREDVGKGGVIRDPALHARAVEKIHSFALSTLHRKWVGCIPSPILGGEGNTEFLALLSNAENLPRDAHVS